MSSSNGGFGRAKALCVPGTLFSLEDSAAVRAAAAMLFTGAANTPAQQGAAARFAAGNPRTADRFTLAEIMDTLTGAELRVATQAVRLSHFSLTLHEPAVPTEAEQAAADVVEARRLAAEAALDTVVLAQVAVRKAKGPEQVEQRRAELRVAEEARKYAHEAHERAQSAFMTLVVERDNRARAALLASTTE